jgi:putative membrane-bound dehydrogenase-like protein
MIAGSIVPVARMPILAAFALGSSLTVASAAEPGPASPLKTPADLEATLFAAEPLLSSPASIDVDARGRVWVCEVTNYHAKRNTRAAGDRILALEDTDGDGRADKQTVFHQGRDVDAALGICVIGEGPGRRVIVSCSPDVMIFHDDDGDLVADRKESLFTQIGQPQHDHNVHAFTVGPDGRWYFNFGNYGKAVHDKDGRPVVDRFGIAVNDKGQPYREGMAFRCRPDGSDFEVLGHNFRNPYETAVDSFGTLWQSDNDDDGNASVRINFVMEQGNYGYKDERTGAGWQVARANIEPEIVRRHWHQNDPGVVPNMLMTGAGAPAGICVYEGTLLPERFRGALVHCEPGLNLVRAYRTAAAGAGYTATVEPIADGSADRWFRPSDVCVAPDGSLIVADWHDPGVGGHGMADTERGRIYRMAPVGSKWSMPTVDLGTIAAAVTAVPSPNHCTRAMALERLAHEPERAAAAVQAAFDAAPAADLRLKARLAWAAAMLLPSSAEDWIARLSKLPEPDLRIVAIRICRAVHGIGAAGGRADPQAVARLVERLASDPSAAVRRECAIALKGIGGAEADRAWAALAVQHAAHDRFALEALGIGADGIPGAAGWDGRLAAWLAAVGEGWKSPAGRKIIWRSRGSATPALILELLVDPSDAAPGRLALVRALDFQDAARVREAVIPVVKRLSNAAEPGRAVLPELVMRLERSDAGDAAVAAKIEETVDAVAGTPRQIDIVRRFGLKGRLPELVRLASSQQISETVAATAVSAILELDGGEALRGGLAANEADRLRLIAMLGIGGRPQTLAILAAIVADPEASAVEKTAALRALCRSQPGGRQLVEMAKRGALTGPAAQVAAVAVATCPWPDVRTAAADVLPMPTSRGGEKLPPVAELRQRKGVADRGRVVFAEAGTCAKCHVVNGEGRSVGPNLSGIGAKLSREAIYEAILAPSAAISHNYETYTALLADGRSLTGLLVSQSPEQVVVKAADGVEIAVPAADVEELVRQPVSLMPADLAAALSAEQLVDLVAYLETLKAAN